MVFFLPNLSAVIPNIIGPMQAVNGDKEPNIDSSKGVTDVDNGLLAGSCIPFKRGIPDDGHAIPIPATNADILTTKLNHVRFLLIEINSYLPKKTAKYK